MSYDPRQSVEESCDEQHSDGIAVPLPNWLRVDKLSLCPEMPYLNVSDEDHPYRDQPK
jgi:hypothetical protein